MTVQNTDVDSSYLFSTLEELRAQDARFLTLTALDRGDELDVIYHFERGQDVVNLRLRTRKDQPVESITSVFGAAFLAENEAQDLFNLKVSGLNVDFGGRMLRIESAIETTLLKPAMGERPTTTRFQGRCRDECPGLVNIPLYLQQIAAGDTLGAYETIMERAPLPAILGRVCSALCQIGCRQEKNESHLQIRLLKRYVADSNGNMKRDIERRKSTGKRVAVVGAGPSGITAAYYLGLLGHDVTVYEKGERFGGAMLWGIPKFRLPKGILQEEVSARFGEAQATFVPGVEIDDLDALLREGYDAIYVAIGAMSPNALRIEGEDSPGVIDCMELLTAVNERDETPDVGDSVLIIGGGNAAIDSARVCRRLGAKDITVFYRRTETEMPALLEDIHASMREGVSFDFLSQPLKIIPGERLTVAFQCMIPGEPDDSGRRRPEPMEGRILMKEVNTVVKAIGNTVSVPETFGLETSRRGWIVVDEEYRTSKEGVWAGGDSVFGPRFVIEAIRDGRKAASSIDVYLGGEGLREPIVDLQEFVARPVDLEDRKDQPMVPVRELPVDERVLNFDEVELGFSPEEAFREATRCWRCDWNE
ncbi:MAG: FAD-dependent oxidoreductase [Candidatus Bathyarchaeota archaeon]|nr:MAG: FAD-dependent oxidoreductase [Candidatus Bathyarchaeota archaeon]